MLDDLFDLSPHEKVLTVYFTMCTIMSSTILQSLRLLVAPENFIWFLYQNTLFSQSGMLDDLCDLSPYEKVLTFYFAMCTIMSNIILQSLGILVALRILYDFYTNLWYKCQSLTSVQGHGHLPTFRLHKKYSYCRALSPYKVVTCCSILRRNARTKKEGCKPNQTIQSMSYILPRTISFSNNNEMLYHM
jgi:uncharacterized membrane protein